MPQLTVAGEQVISELAQKHGFSEDAVLSMLNAIINGNGSMAQFNHAEFGGSGQWMRGGMIMTSDMFNNQLKGRIDGLCNDLSDLVASQSDLIRSGSFQSQSQGDQHQRNDQPRSDHSQQQTGFGVVGRVSLFVPPPPGSSSSWWPGDIGSPNSTGSQNNIRYAYFQKPRRLAIEVGGAVTIYDTLDHAIGGFSQQQSSGGSLTFSSQHGLVRVDSLPVVSLDEVQSVPTPPNASSPTADIPPQGDIFNMIDRLAELHSRKILTDDEFASKKAELLSRL